MNDFLRQIFNLKNKGSFITRDVFLKRRVLKPKLTVTSTQSVLI